MTSNSSMSIDKADKYIRLSTKNYRFHPSIINGIQRIMLNYMSSYTFDMFLDPNDFTFLSETLNIPRLNPKHQRYTTLSCNTQFPIPMISLHISRQAISSEAIIEDIDIIENTNVRKVYFAICAPKEDESDPIKRISKPLVNNNATPLILYAHNLTPFVFTRKSVTDPWGFDETESYKVQKNLEKVFVYNGKVALIENGKNLNVILKAEKVMGKTDPAGSPCRSSYRWVMNPEFKEKYPVVDKDFVLRRKIEGEPGAKDMFLMVPISGDLASTTASYSSGELHMAYQNKFGKPYGTDLLMAYNGKQNPASVMRESIKKFIENLRLMDIECNKESEVIHKMYLDNSVTLTIPLNVDMDLTKYQNGKYEVLMDDSILHSVSVKVLELLDNIIGDDISIWENISVYYKVPHRLIAQSILCVKLPEESEDFIEKISKTYKLTDKSKNVSLLIIRHAINSVISDLESIESLI